MVSYIGLGIFSFALGPRLVRSIAIQLEGLRVALLFKGLNIRIPIIVPFRGEGLSIRGLHQRSLSVQFMGLGDVEPWQ